MGVCPQQDVLFDTLTVYEHVYFYCKLKGLSDERVEEEIQYYIGALELDRKKHVKASKLSRQGKRKLCIALALCANSKAFHFYFLSITISILYPSIYSLSVLTFLKYFLVTIVN